jgi:hypothetical protein
MGCSVDDLRAEFVNQSAVLCHRYELDRRYRPSIRVPPAGERSRADNPAGFQRHERLVVDVNRLLAGQRCAN